MARVKFGDIVEIPTSVGFAYAQYTHKHESYGALLRIFERICVERPSDFGDVVSTGLRFSTWFPLGAAVHRKIFQVVANLPISDDLQQFPLFRAEGVPVGLNQVSGWWLWDGSKSWQIGKLTSAQKKLPIKEIINDTMLIFRVETNWRPETDPLTNRPLG